MGLWAAAGWVLSLWDRRCVFDFIFLFHAARTRRVCLLPHPFLSARLPSATLLCSDASAAKERRGEGVKKCSGGKTEAHAYKCAPVLQSSRSAHVPFSLALCPCSMAAAPEAVGGLVPSKRVVTVYYRPYGKRSDGELECDRVLAGPSMMDSITSLVGAVGINGIALLLRDPDGIIVPPHALISDPSITSVTVEFKDQAADSRLMTGITPLQRGCHKRPFGASFTGLEGKGEEMAPPMPSLKKKRAIVDVLGVVRHVLRRPSHNPYLSASSTYVFAHRLLTVVRAAMTNKRMAMRRVRRRRWTSMRTPRLGALKPRKASLPLRERTAITCSPRARIASC